MTKAKRDGYHSVWRACIVLGSRILCDHTAACEVLFGKVMCSLETKMWPSFLLSAATI